MPLTAARPHTVSLNQLALRHGLLIGTLADPALVTVDKQYSAMLVEQFGVVSVRNDLKFRRLRPAADTYDFAAADRVVAFAQENGLQVRGHSLIYYRSIPRWLQEGDYSRDEMIAIMRDHITTVMQRYATTILVWDVVNEAFDAQGNFRDDDIWYQRIGPEYVELAFRFAREANPQAVLIYNDYDAEALNRKSNRIYRLAQDFRRRGVPLDGIGLQMHLNAATQPYYPPAERIGYNMDRLAQLNLQVQITEMDVRIWRLPGSLEEKLQAQADVYASMLRTCLAHANCTTLNLWGFTDRYSWVYVHYGGSYPDEAPLIFDPEYQPKPAYFALVDTLRTWQPAATPKRWPVHHQHLPLADEASPTVAIPPARRSRLLLYPGRRPASSPIDTSYID